jgi:uncharacterized protein (TIGR03435 family)
MIHMRQTARLSLRIAVVGVTCCAGALVGNKVLLACTAFCAVGGGQVLVGNNEDWNNPRTKIRFVPARPGSYGRMYVGFDDMWPQGGMNERGLWFDGFSAPRLKAAPPSDLPHFQGNLIDKVMAECATVEEVVRLFSQYNRDFLTATIFMFADASGDAVSIERDAIVRKTGRHFVQTNFHQSQPRTGLQDERFEIASTMLERAGDEISLDLFRRILAATHQKGGSPTLYSNIYDLKSRTMHLYHFRDFERVVTFDLAEELKKGERVLDMPALFPRNAAAEKFAARRREADQVPGPAAAIAFVALPLAVIAIAVFTWIRGGRRFRLGLSMLVGTIVIFVLLSVVAVRMHRRASSAWTEFSIGPASGKSTSIGTNMMRANGVTLKVALATAYDVPAVRVIGPPWLDDTRYSINAAVPPEASDSFRSLLQQELNNRLRLETHFEVRPFDVFVLTATDASRLERAYRKMPSIWILDWDAELQNASMERLAGALQSVLRRPVIDETGITGTFDLEFEWREDRVASVTAAIHDRYGLRLSPAKRDLEVLIVDRVQRDAALVLLAQIGRITSGAPPQLRQQIASLLTIR